MSYRRYGRREVCRLFADHSHRRIASVVTTRVALHVCLARMNKRAITTACSPARRCYADLTQCTYRKTRCRASPPFRKRVSAEQYRSDAVCQYRRGRWTVSLDRTSRTASRGPSIALRRTCRDLTKIRGCQNVFPSDAPSLLHGVPITEGPPLAVSPMKPLLHPHLESR